MYTQHILIDIKLNAVSLLYNYDKNNDNTCVYFISRASHLTGQSSMRASDERKETDKHMYTYELVCIFNSFC